jgi:hypothetical protein
MEPHRIVRTEGPDQLPKWKLSESIRPVTETSGTPFWGKTVSSLKQSKSIWVSYESLTQHVYLTTISAKLYTLVWFDRFKIAIVTMNQQVGKRSE